jgi:hypothetical protein
MTSRHLELLIPTIIRWHLHQYTHQLATIDTKITTILNHTTAY